jgi:hypothetical protein
MIGLDANQVGELSDQQRQNLGALARYRRRNAATIALFLLAVAAILMFAPNPKAPLVQRELVAAGAAFIAAFLIVRAVTGSDALTRDLRESRVESVEGAIGKRRLSGGRAQGVYFLDVGDRSFKVGPGTYHDAPDAGWVRAYYLPLSKRIVNLERLPNASAPPELTRDGIVRAIGATLSGSRREANEARAGIASVGDALKAAFDRSQQPPSSAARDPRPLAQAILGTSANPLVRVTFSEDGLATVRMFGGDKNGRWSVDADGRLHASVMGHEQSVEAWVAGETLSIVADGRTITLTREAL